MIATYPLRGAFLRRPRKWPDLRQCRRKAEGADADGPDSDQMRKTATGAPETGNDNYHLGRMIYKL